MRQEQLGIKMVTGGVGGTAGVAETVDSLGQKCADREIACHSP
jgi:hypothetical protein